MQTKLDPPRGVPRAAFAKAFADIAEQINVHLPTHKGPTKSSKGDTVNFAEGETITEHVDLDVGPLIHVRGTTTLSKRMRGEDVESALITSFTVTFFNADRSKRRTLVIDEQAAFLDDFQRIKQELVVADDTLSWSQVLNHLLRSYRYHLYYDTHELGENADHLCAFAGYFTAPLKTAP